MMLGMMPLAGIKPELSIEGLNKINSKEWTN